MSRFIRRGGEVSSAALTLGDITQGFTNVYSSTTSGSFTFPASTTRAKVIATGGGGGGSYNYGSSYYRQSRGGGGGGGTVIAYIDAEVNRSLSWSIGTAGCTCVFNFSCCGCDNCGTAGGTTSVSGTNVSIFACGGGTSRTNTFGYWTSSGVGGSGCAGGAGILGCFIIDGNAGGAHSTWWCFDAACNWGADHIEGGSTYFGRGAIANGQWSGSFCCGCYCTTTSLPTYGGGGMGGAITGCCCWIPAVQPAAGLVYIEYN